MQGPWTLTADWRRIDGHHLPIHPNRNHGLGRRSQSAGAIRQWHTWVSAVELMRNSTLVVGLALLVGIFTLPALALRHSTGAATEAGVNTQRLESTLVANQPDPPSDCPASDQQCQQR